MSTTKPSMRPPTLADLDALPYAWVVDLEARVMTSHRLESGAWRISGTYSDETEARLEPFDVVPINVVGWWPPTASEGQR